MANEQVMERLTEIFRDVFDDDSLTIHEAMTAADVDEWDSLNHINLVVAVEKAFGIKFTTKEIMAYENVGQFADAVDVKTAEKG